ncbi:MAG TPA: clostripain-related cysteine peptidase [Pyrinomonadaceae bacterium]|nr:clostripain-related cysteine peptidase [Pyrinomonadaceae bacterium]
MSTESETPKDEPKNDWTVMFFFAGDNQLSPSMISQLKAIKDAGFQKNTTVLIYFDPNERGSQASIFEVNRKRKLERTTVIGDGKDPFVRNLREDNIDANKGAHDKATASQALEGFLNCGLHRPAKHYLVFLVGHGMIVGNDAFLPDARPDSAISLEQLGDILGDFSRKAEKQGGAVELIGLHSCSMSGVEVAYQLKGAAKYMMATEGVAFVSSWPYRQVMKKVLKTIQDAQSDKKGVDIEQLVKSIQDLSLRNSTDFMFSGLSADVCLCSLDPTKVEALNGPIKKLTSALKNGLRDSRGLEIIKLAHLKAQSYFQETYTDLYDFCFCLEEQCEKDDGVQEDMLNACRAVRDKLNESKKPEGLIVESATFGPEYQYSHGMSIYFPWSAPIEDPFEDILGRYRKYDFTRALGDHSWLSFLEEYFKATLRKTREMEDTYGFRAAQMEERFAFGANGNGDKSNGHPTSRSTPGFALTDGDSLPGGAGDGKVSPPLGIGSCHCSVKNYPRQFVGNAHVSWDPTQGAVKNGAGQKKAESKQHV